MIATKKHHAHSALAELQRMSFADPDAASVLDDALERQFGDRDPRVLLKLAERRDLLASAYQAEGRDDIARLWRDELPSLPTALRRRKRIDSMTTQERDRMPGHAAKWIAIGLSTAQADRPLFEAGAHAIYRRIGWDAPRIVWTTSPIAVAIAAPMAAYLIAGGNKDHAVRGAVDGAVGDAVYGAVGDAVRGAVVGAVVDAVNGAVVGAVVDAVNGAVDGADRTSNVEPRLQTGFLATIKDAWWRLMGGQFWVGSYYWYGSPSFVSFVIDELGLKLDEDLELKTRAYWATAMSACWWWPHRDFVIVSERPTELVKSDERTLKHVTWSDGWGVRK